MKEDQNYLQFQGRKYIQNECAYKHEDDFQREFIYASANFGNKMQRIRDNEIANKKISSMKKQISNGIQDVLGKIEREAEYIH